MLIGARVPPHLAVQLFLFPENILEQAVPLSIGAVGGDGDTVVRPIHRIVSGKLGAFDECKDDGVFLADEGLADVFELQCCTAVGVTHSAGGNGLGGGYGSGWGLMCVCGG